MSPGSREAALARYARELGWRAYAIPVLVVITVWVLVDVFSAPADRGAQDSGRVSSTAQSTDRGDATDTAGTDGGRRPGPDPADSPRQQLPVDQLPPGGGQDQAGHRQHRGRGGREGQPGGQPDHQDGHGRGQQRHDRGEQQGRPAQRHTGVGGRA